MKIQNQAGANKFRLNLCLPYAYAYLNLKYDFENRFSEILYYLNTMFSFSFFFNGNFVHNRKHYIAVRNNYFTSSLIKRYLVKITDRQDFIFD